MNKDLYHPAPSTVGEALRIYLELLNIKQSRLIRTALLRYVAPAWGAPASSGKRLTTKEQSAALSFLNTIPLQELASAIELQEKEFKCKSIAREIQRTNRYRLKQFVDWATQQGWLEERKQKQVYSFSPKCDWRMRTSNLVVKQPYALKDGEMSSVLLRELEDFRVFCKSRLNLRDATVKQSCMEVRRFLGWMHRYKHYDLEELSLLSIIQKNSSYVVEVTQENIYQYFTFLEDRFASQRESVRAFVKVAKYLYRLETKNFSNLRDGGFRDIEVIQALRRISREETGPRYDTSTSKLPYEKRAASWEQVIDVLRGLQVEVELDHKSKWNKYHQAYNFHKRPDTAIASCLQKLLIVCFFVTMPPDRNRTIRELEIGRTFVKGRFRDGVFIPSDKVTDGESKWYVHLTPDDYKTGKYYGEYWSEVPNTPLDGGKDFYQYIDLWIYKYRGLFKPSHNFLFVRTRPPEAKIGEPLNRAGIHARVKTAFIKFIGVPVSPQVLRKMYITYLKNSKATEAELEAAATAMHHSREMQSKVYDQRTKAEKMKPIFEFNQNLFEKAFRET